MTKQRIGKHASMWGMTFLMVLAFASTFAFAIEPWDGNEAYWEHNNQPVLLLGSSATEHLFLADGLPLPLNTVLPEVPTPLDLNAHLDAIQAMGGNYVRNVMSQRTDILPPAYKLLANGKYDLNQFDDDCDAAAPNGDIGSNCYWTRFKGFLEETAARGIFVQIELWDRFNYWTATKDIWGISPWHPQNNINYNEADSGLDATYTRHPSDDVHPFFHGVPEHPCYPPTSTGTVSCSVLGEQALLGNTQAQYDTVRGFQEKFVDKMLSYSLNYDHVLYVINNETSTHIAWGLYWIDYIKFQAAQQGKTVFVTDSFDFLFDPFPGEPGHEDVVAYRDHPNDYDFLEISQVDQSTNGNGVTDVRGHAQDHWNVTKYIMDNALGVKARPVNHVKIYGTGYFNTPPGPDMGIHRQMNNLLLGAAGVRPHRLDQPQEHDLLPYDEALRSVRMVENRVKFWDLVPRNDLLAPATRLPGEAFVGAKEGEAYVVYFPEGGSVGLDLGAAGGQQFDLEWIDHATAMAGSVSTVPGGGTATITAPTPTGAWIAILTLQPTGDKLLTVTKVGSGSGTITSSPTGINCGSDCTESYPMGTVVTLTATPVSGSQFDGWSGDAACAGGVVTMNTAVSCTAMFNLTGSQTQPLTVTLAGNGSGSVTSSPTGINCGSDCTESYLMGTVVTLTATPASGSQFVDWSGDAACADGVVTMNTAVSCTANFTLLSTQTERIPQSQMSVVSVSADPANKDNVLDGDSETRWGPSGGGPHEMILSLGGSHDVNAFYYQPSSWTKCTQYEVYVSPTNGNWGAAVASSALSGDWANDGTEKEVTFPAKTGAFLRVHYLNSYCYAGEHNVGKAGSTPPQIERIPQSQMSVVSVSADPANKDNVLDGDSETRWGPSGGGPHEMILSLGGSHDVNAFYYQPSSWTKCTQYEVYVSPTNGNWGAAVASSALSGDWANDGTEKEVSFSPKTGAFLRVRYLNSYCYAGEHNVGSSTTEPGGPIPQSQMSVVSVSADPANKDNVLDGDSETRWGPSGGGPHEMILSLGGSYNVNAFRYQPSSWTKCTQYEVYVSPTNGNWGTAVASSALSGDWANDGTEKEASFSPKTGAFLRVRYLNSYCYAGEHNVGSSTTEPGGPIPQSQMSVVSVSADPANKDNVLDGDSETRWGPSGGGPHEMILSLGGSYNVNAFRYQPSSWTKCTQYEVYVSPTNGNWGTAVASSALSGDWANDGTEKEVSFSPKTGAFLRVRYLNSYCYAGEHNVESGGS